MESLAPLSSLERVEGALLIVDNALLPSLDGLDGLTHARTVVVDQNPMLADASAIQGLVSVRERLVFGQDDPGLAGNDGEGNDVLVGLPPFDALIEAPESLVIGGNDQLVRLGRPPALEGSVAFVGVFDNPELPHADAVNWASAIADPADTTICGCLDDPEPDCRPFPP